VIFIPGVPVGKTNDTPFVGIVAQTRQSNTLRLSGPIPLGRAEQLVSYRSSHASIRARFATFDLLVGSWSLPKGLFKVR